MNSTGSHKRIPRGCVMRGHGWVHERSSTRSSEEVPRTAQLWATADRCCLTFPFGLFALFLGGNSRNDIRAVPVPYLIHGA
jgi:hypothetical protein